MIVDKLQEAITTLNAKKVIVTCDKQTAKIIKSNTDIASKCEIIENYHMLYLSVAIIDYVVDNNDENK